MTLYERSGSCNLCGECCGGGDGEQYGPPFRGHDQLNNQFPADNPWFIRMFPSQYQGGNRNGNFKENGVWYRWIYIDGVGFCLDDPPFGNTNSFTKQCPMLMDDPGDGTHPCVMYNSDTYNGNLGMTLGEVWTTY